MVFSSLLFLFRFFPAALLLYYIIPRKVRNLSLLFASLVFYAWGGPPYLLLMLASILVSYAGGIFVERFKKADKANFSKITAAASVAINLSMLAVFKYADFLLETVNGIARTNIALPRLALPIGISFYTFQTVSYIIDVYRGEAAAQKKFVSYATYISMFPQLIAGPIVQYKTIATQLAGRRENLVGFSEGACRFVSGLGKKVLLANSAGVLWEASRGAEFSQMPVLTAWLGLFAYTMQIYFDFSAYSDMAIGLGRMFGFSFLENFEYPYTSKSVSEFWRRWHISLGSWFREYVYIPLGGNRGGKLRTALVVFARLHASFNPFLYFRF